MLGMFLKLSFVIMYTNFYSAIYFEGNKIYLYLQRICFSLTVI